MEASGTVQPILERERELAQLEHALEDAAAGRGRLVAIEGAAGLGKTRLVGEATSLAGRRGMLALTARGSPVEREFAFGVVRQLFEPTIAASPDDRRRDLFAGAAGHAQPLIEGAPDSPAHAESAYAVLHGLYWLTQNLALDAPLLIAVDDAPWADESSLRFLLFLAARLADLPVALVVALRSGERDTEERLVAQLAASAEAGIVRPAPLSAGATAELIEHGLGLTSEGEFALACHEAVAGNPFMTEALCRELEAQGIAPEAANAARVKALGPRTVSRALLLRLTAMGESVGAFVRALAVLGDSAELSHVAALAGLDEAPAAEAADLLAEASILKRSSTLEFLHPIVREAVYADLRPRERAASHALAAHVLREAGASRERVAAQLRHTEPSGDAKTIEILTAAAAAARTRGAIPAAIAYLERALVEPPPPERRGEVVFELGVAEALGQREVAAEHLREGLELADSPAETAERGLALGQALFLGGQTRAAFEVTSECADGLAPDASEAVLELEALALMVAFAAGLHRDAAQRAQALEPRLSSSSAATAAVFGSMALGKLVVAAPRDEVLADVDRALVGGTLDLENIHRPGRDVPALVLSWLDEFDRAAALYTGAIEACQSMGEQPIFGYLSASRAGVLQRSGDLRRAEADIESALAAAGDELSFGRLIALLYRAHVLLDQGHPEDAERLAASAGVPPPAPGETAVCALHHAIGAAQLAQQRFEDAATTLEGAGQALVAGDCVTPMIAPWRSDLALALAGAGRREEGLARAREELELAERADVESARGAALRALGLVEGGERGLELLDRSVSAYENSPRRLERARALCDSGAALRRANRRREARERLGRAHELALACGGHAVVERAAAELGALGVRTRRDVNRRDQLTPSERRVADLAAEGRPNAEIAQSLFVSLKTVEGHLSACYRKLDIPSRAELPEALAKEGG